MEAYKEKIDNSPGNTLSDKNAPRIFASLYASPAMELDEGKYISFNLIFLKRIENYFSNNFLS